MRYKGLAHTLFVAFGSSFSGASALVEKVHWTGFPNVFDPRWEAYCESLARRKCAEMRSDPWLFGYFLDNELEWYGKTHRPEGIWTDTMKWGADHTGKLALVAHVRAAHADLAEFNRVWQQNAASWDDLATLEALPAGSDRAREIQLAFLGEVADRYFRVAAGAIRKADPNHLVIGSRFAGNAPEWAWRACARYCDVVTLNQYPRVDMETEDLSGIAETYGRYHALVDKPMMVTEWSFPALDAGLPCTHGAGMRVDTQEQKTHCVEMLQHLHFRLPFLVGSNYFMWADEPKEGISDTFPEDSNYGLNNVDDKPYPLLTGMFARLNPMAVALHAGEVPEGYIDELTLAAGQIRIAIRNAGAIQATFHATIRDGNETVSAPRVSLGPGATASVGMDAALPPGCHVLEAELEPDGGWAPRGCRGRTRRIACAVVPGPGVAVGNLLALRNPAPRALPRRSRRPLPPRPLRPTRRRPQSADGRRRRLSRHLDRAGRSRRPVAEPGPRPGHRRAHRPGRPAIRGGQGRNPARGRLPHRQRHPPPRARRQERQRDRPLPARRPPPRRLQSPALAAAQGQPVDQGGRLRAGRVP